MGGSHGGILVHNFFLNLFIIIFIIIIYVYIKIIYYDDSVFLNIIVSD